MGIDYYTCAECELIGDDYSYPGIPCNACDEEWLRRYKEAEKASSSGEYVEVDFIVPKFCIVCAETCLFTDSKLKINNENELIYTACTQCTKDKNKRKPSDKQLLEWCLKKMGLTKEKATKKMIEEILKT